MISGSHRDDTQFNNISKVEIRRTNKALVLSTGINKYIPTNLIHQNNYGAALKLYYITGNLNQRLIDNTGGIFDFRDNFITRRAGVNVFYNHAIYPNTRTIVTFAFQSEYGYDDEEEVHGTYGYTNIYGALSYFISYRTRLNCNFGAQYQKNYIDDSPFLIGGSPENFWLYANAGIQINL
ncbi:MAG: hypothetical protein ABIN67_12285 [Ferruginibacter sp.]